MKKIVLNTLNLMPEFKQFRQNSGLRCHNQRKASQNDNLTGGVARRSAIPRNRVVAGGKIFELVASVCRRNFFPQHSGGYKLRARRAAARNFRPLTRFQMFPSSREGSSKLCRDVFRGLHSIKYARLRDKILIEIL